MGRETEREGGREGERERQRERESGMERHEYTNRLLWGRGNKGGEGAESREKEK